MRRTGSAIAGQLLPLALLFASTAAWAQVEFHQSVDREKVGLEDTFRLTIVVSNAPDGAQLNFPTSDDFEILSRSQSTQASFSFGSGAGGSIRRVQTYTLVMRANRKGTLTLPAAVLTTDDKTYRTEAIRLQVQEGRLHSPRAKRRTAPDPFKNFPFPGFPDPFGGSDEPGDFDPPDMDVPRSDSDLFVRMTLDRKEVFVGEQATMSLYIYSRVDLSSVDQVQMPKLDGFWSEDIESPTQLSAEQKVIDGVPYRAYLLRRRALFPMRAGKLSIDPASADITTGFLFAGHRVKKKSNALTLEVKPLPPGAPPGMSSGNVGQWRLSAGLSQDQVELGQPVTVKVTLEGTGNLKNVIAPPLTAPPSLKVYDPTASDRLSVNRGRIGGRRTQEYLVMPQQTGNFTLPSLALPYFNPESGSYETARTEPLALTVVPGAGGQGQPTVATAEAGAKNVLTANGVRPLRENARFRSSAAPLWQRGFFLPAVLAPVGLWLGLGLVGLLRGRLKHEDEGSRLSRQARAARKRLVAAERLVASADAGAFYAEVEKALMNFLEAKLSTPAVGLTRDALSAKMASAGVRESVRTRLVAVLDTCDVGRFASGAAGQEARRGTLDEAAAAMEGWDRR